jgi:RHH-type transcriptional regulator, proline utilization regulon repressor / proline dehydrogenase / delta 1-pyrroline-5-carboxylate dehydrogenase
MQMQESPLIKKAKDQIEAAKGEISLTERKDRAVALAALMLEEAQRIQTPAEKRQQAQLAGMMRDSIGKAFTTMLTDQCFRSNHSLRIADQLVYVIKRLGIPRFLPASKRLSLQAFATFGKALSSIAVPLTIRMIRKETNNVILPGEERPLNKHMQKRRGEGVRINLNHLGEAILGEKEAQHRLQIYLNDLAKPEVEYISVKISTIYSQINLLDWQKTLLILADRLRQLYRAAIKFRYLRPDGVSVPKFVNLDMEEYRDLQLTVALFRQVLDEPEFYQHEAGIVLQSYLPDSFLIQQELTVWAMQRLLQGGAAIKIRIVKGANLAMEQFESALRLWPQAPYMSKADVDANFKRMVAYGCQKEHAKAAHLGIGSHNLFDIAYALLLRAENNVQQEVGFEMLEGMADHIRRVVQQLSGDMLLYCPAATKEEFQNAVAYLVRRLDENTAPENFLRQAFDLMPGTSEWTQQVKLFSDACFASKNVSYFPRRTQNRQMENLFVHHARCFENEPDTDWSLPQNRKWVEKILQEWSSKNHPLVPLVIGGKSVVSQEKTGVGEDPSKPGQILYHYALATEEQVDQAIEVSKKAETSWSQTSVEERMDLLAKVANELRKNRSDLIGVMVADTGKTVTEADVEVSEAIDFAEFYRLNLEEWHHLPDIQWKSKGTILVAPPWNFPCSIPAGGILAALGTGNCVIFKPATESILVGWHLVQLFWKAGISRHVLQFITCEDDPVGSRLVKDPRITAIVLTGATATAKLFLRMRPGLDLIAETGGKNTLVITGMSDRDLAIKDLLQSAFGHAGQKCSACSLAILEAEVYDDPHFLQQLKDAAESLAVGSPWNLQTKINPLIRPPNPILLQVLRELEIGEEWLLEPRQDKDNPNLWSPGIKLGVKPSSFTFQNELFGPILGLVRADSIEHAFYLMNQTPYGLTAGIHSLDEREQDAWLQRIEAGNCYINRTITGAIVERQPFGGCKESCFGKGSKAGGPNYLIQLMESEQITLPSERAAPNSKIKALSKVIEHSSMLAIDLSLWKASVSSYAFYWKEYFSKSHDPCLVLGQDNLQRYVPHKHIVFRGQQGDSTLDLLRIVAAAFTCGAHLEISLEQESVANQLKDWGISDLFPILQESDEAFVKRVREGKIKRVRLLKPSLSDVQNALADAACHLNVGAVMANGRLELLHFLREVSVSRDYHRYGNLGLREKEKRRPLPGSPEEGQFKTCEGCDCHD